MSVKQVDLPGFGQVAIYKRRDSRALKITIDHNNRIRVIMPSWLPYRAALEFVKSKESWIEEHRRPHTVLKPGDAVGKAHRLEFVNVFGIDSVGCRLAGQAVRVSMPQNIGSADLEAQIAARRGVINALRKEAKALLPMRLKQLAVQYEFGYKSIHVKQLRARWGSCSQQSHITLNLFLMQLPWNLIDYVILHELTHTKHLHHGTAFWAHLESCVPSAKDLRKELRTFQPQI